MTRNGYGVVECAQVAQHVLHRLVGESHSSRTPHIGASVWMVLRLFQAASRLGEYWLFDLLQDLSKVVGLGSL